MNANNNVRKPSFGSYESAEEVENPVHKVMKLNNGEGGGLIKSTALEDPETTSTNGEPSQSPSSERMEIERPQSHKAIHMESNPREPLEENVSFEHPESKQSSLFSDSPHLSQIDLMSLAGSPQIRQFSISSKKLEDHLKTIKNFEQHTKSTSAPASLQAIRLATELTLYPEKSLTLLQWLTFFYPLMDRVVGQLTYQYKAYAFQEVLSWSHVMRIRISEFPAGFALDENAFASFPEYFVSNLNLLLENENNKERDEIVNDIPTRLCFGDEEIKTFCGFLKDSKVNTLQPYVLNMCWKKCEGEAGYEIYFCYNTVDPYMYDLFSNEKSQKKERKGILHNYNTDNKGNIADDFVETDYHTSMKIHLFRLFISFLRSREIFSEDIICQMRYQALYRTSTNPIYWISQPLINSFDCPQNNFSIAFTPEISKIPFSLSSMEIENEAQEIASFLRHLAVNIRDYAYNCFKLHREKAILSAIHGNIRNPKRTESLLQGLSKYNIFKPEDIAILDNAETWEPHPSRKEKIEAEKMLNKPDVDELITYPLSRAILSNQINIDEANKLLLNMGKEETERGVVIVKNLPKIAAKLRSLKTFKDEVEKKGSAPLPPRRQIMAYFLSSLEAKGKSYAEEIQDMLFNFKDRPAMEKALESYISLTLTPSFISAWLDLLLIFDDEHSDTKQGGIFVRGASNLGKSFLFKIILWPFNVYYVSNTNNNTVPADLLGNPTRVYEIRAHFYFLDEWNAKAFDQNSTLPIQDFNNLFDVQKDPRTLNIKGGTIHLRGNAAVVLCSHHPPEFFGKRYDPSFSSRFTCALDLDEPIVFENDPDFEGPDGHESAHEWKQRSKKKNPRLIQEKPLFPLTCGSSATSTIDPAVVQKAIFSDKQTRPAISNFKKDLFKEVKSRQEMLKSNPISEGWNSFRELSFAQASFLTHKVLIRFADKLWMQLSDAQKEDRFPLYTRRSLKPENDEKYGTLFRHSHFHKDALLPSVFLNYPELIESPQAICLLIVSKNPKCLITKPNHDALSYYQANLPEINEDRPYALDMS